MKSAMLHKDAEAELREALICYAAQKAGLDGEFRREFEAALIRVRENPQAYAIEELVGVRYCPLRRFPYMIVYIEQQDGIWVAAVAHLRRRPRYWIDRRPT